MEIQNYHRAMESLKELQNNINSLKSPPDLILLRNLYHILYSIHHTSKFIPDTELVANTSLTILEDLWSLKSLQLNKSLQILLCSIYEYLFLKSPGYVIRNILNSLLNILNQKSVQSNLSLKECLIMIFSACLEKRSQDIGNMVTDIVNIMIRFIRNGSSNETALRLLSLQGLISLLTNAGSRVTEFHLELSKLLSKLNTDRSVEIRQKSASLICALASSSNGFTTVSFDSLCQLTLKGLEDEVNIVQEAYAKAMAVIHYELINAHLEDQEQTKIGLARGGSAAEQSRNKMTSNTSSSSSSSHRGSLSKLKDITSFKDMMMSSSLTSSSSASASGSSNSSSSKKTDENDYKSIIKSLIRNMIKSSTSATLRAGYVSSLRHLIQLLLPSILQQDALSSLEWLAMTLISILKESQITTLSYEEIVYFRCRLSHLFHKGLTALLSESNQILLCKTLYLYLSTTDVRTEHEIQFILTEICHLIQSLQEISISLQEELKSMINIQLRHSSFGVRATAAYVLMSLASMIPAVASTYFKDALTGAAIQVKQLLSFDESDYSSASDGGVMPSEESTQTNKRTPKDTERLQRMFYFHGHSLVISIFLKNEKLLPTGLPNDLIMKAFDFGLEMLLLDIQSAPTSLRHLVCSVIRAGSLIVSSCLNMGYKVAKERIHQLLDCCTTLLRSTNTPPTSSSGSGSSSASTSGSGSGSSSSNSNNPDLLYELMSTEAALVCISTLLWFCPDSLVYDENCLITIIDGLENAFRAIKTKYQSKFRGHFRFRTLHVILLECFAWLPPGSFPATCSQLFVEALRVFRDSITANYESTCLPEFIPSENSLLYLNGITKPLSLGYWDIPFDEDLLILQFEHYSVALQKKESEAFLACFTKEIISASPFSLSTSPFSSSSSALALASASTTALSPPSSSSFQRTPLHANDWMEPSPPCAFIDSRTVDASIALLAATFGHQTNEYQDKAIQLCSQALTQYLSIRSSSSSSSSSSTSVSVSLGLFTNEEEKKKRERKSYLTIKNVTSVLSAIIRSFPFHNGMSLEIDLHWVQIVSEKLFDILSYPNLEIKLAAANALGIFCSKIFGTQLMDSTGMKITQTIKTSIERKSDHNALNELSGHVVALSSLWIHASNYPTFQNNIMNILFDTLKRIDCSIIFRAHVLFALSVIVNYRSAHYNREDAREEIVNLIERLISAMEVHLVCGSSPMDPQFQHEYPLLFLCIQRLINSTVALILQYAPDAATASTTASAAVSGYLSSLIHMWSIIRKAYPHIYQLQDECADFLLSFPTIPAAMDLMEVVEFVKDALRYPDRGTLIHLSKFVGCIRKVVLTDTEVVVEFGLDVELFKLLDWCVASSTASFSSSPFWGVELRSDISPILIGDTTLLQRKIEEVMNLLVILNVQSDPDRNGASWVLLSRAIALGLKEQTSAPLVENANEEGDGLPSGDVKDESKEPPGGALASMTYVQFTSWCRDVAIERGRLIQSTRLQLKYLSLRCAITAIIECKTSLQSSSCHSNLLHARKSTQENLIQLAAAVTAAAATTAGGGASSASSSSASASAALLSLASNKEELLKTLPCYLSLFMNDLISMGCACASFSIDDHRLLGLQTISIEYLQAIVDLFWNTLDPDDITNAVDSTGNRSSSSLHDDLYPLDLTSKRTPGGEGATTAVEDREGGGGGGGGVILVKPEKKILNQYMAQVISAIRPTLATEWSPSLLWTSGNLIFGFISSGLLTDKIIIKRLIKAFLIIFDTSSDTQPPFLPRCYTSLAVRSDIALVQHINTATNMAKIYLLTTSYCTEFGQIDVSLQDTIRTSFVSHLAEILEVWKAIATDAVRMLQGHNLWPKITSETDCHRGGITYPPHSDCLRIYRYYLYSLPYLLPALASAASSVSTPPPAAPPAAPAVAASTVISMSSSENVAFLSLNFLAMQYLDLLQTSTTNPNKEEILSLEEEQEDTILPEISHGILGASTSADDSMMIETQFIHQNIQTLSKPLLYAAYLSFLKTQNAASAATDAAAAAAAAGETEATQESSCYPLEERILVLKYLTENLFQSHRRNSLTSLSDLEESTIRYTLLSEIFQEFITQVETETKTTEGNFNQDNKSSRVTLMVTLWVSHMAMMRSLLSGMFAETSSPPKASAEGAAGAGGAREEKDDDKEKDEEVEVLDLYSPSSLFPVINFQEFSFFTKNPHSVFWINNFRGVKILVKILRNMSQLIHWFSSQSEAQREVEAVVDLEGTRLFSRYFTELLVNLLPYTTLYVLKSETKQLLTSLMNELFCGLPSGEILDCLQVDLWRWQQWSVKATTVETTKGSNSSSSSSNSGTPFPPPLPLSPHSSSHSNASTTTVLVNLQSITETSQAVFEMWLTVAVESSLLKQPIPSPLPLTAVLLATNTPQCFLNGILLASLKCLQTHSVDSQRLPLALSLLTTSLLPITSHLLTSSVSRDSSSATSSLPSSSGSGSPIQPEILLLQLLFLMFNLHPTDPFKAFHLKAILPTLCVVIQQRGFSDPLSLICGKGITHIARTSPQIFKGEIMLVSDEYKLLLQNAMKMVLEQQNQNQQSTSNGNVSHRGSSGSGSNSSQGLAGAGAGGGVATGASGGFKKLDMSKFKKAAAAAAVPVPAPVVSTSSLNKTETLSTDENPDTES